MAAKRVKLTVAQLSRVQTVEQLKDRRDYRQALIHRVATAHGERRSQLEFKIGEVEAQIRVLDPHDKAGERDD